MPSPDVSARSVALDLLAAVLGDKRPLDEAVDTHPAMPGLARRDRAFARHLLITTIRRLGQIDAAIAACLDRRLPRKARPVTDLLRLGVCQLLFLETPPHAAVDTAVRLARARDMGPYAKMVNAVLRRIGREGRALIAAQDAPRLNTPDWLWDTWSAAYGNEVCRRIAEAHLDQAPLDLSVKEGGSACAKKLGATVLPTGSLRLFPRGPVDRLAGYSDGAWWVQDVAAALPVRLLGDVRGQHVIDLCAAPGGKTAQLAARGARVTAVDRSPQRLARLETNLSRLGLSAGIVAADAARWRPGTPADAVIVDAPCTSTGTIRRRPDVARHKKPDDVVSLAAVQAALLAAAIDMVRPGGLLVYSSCSLQPGEGPEQVTALLKAGAPLEPERLRPDDVGGLAEVIATDGALRTLPCHLSRDGGMDGFYAARLRRR